MAKQPKLELGIERLEARIAPGLVHGTGGSHGSNGSHGSKGSHGSNGSHGHGSK
jgi:hypothetical protein